jgi:conjugative transfer pilus assembly protein TraH
MRYLLTLAIAFIASANAGMEAPIRQMFDDAYVSSSGALKFESQARGYMTFGHARVRLDSPLGTIRPFSVTPPSVNMGCNGIDINLGGFSYIKGDELVNKLKSMSGAASAFFFQAALSTLCKDCATILNKLEDFANAINNLNFDSCAAAKAVGTHFGSKFGEAVRDAGKSGKEVAEDIADKPSLIKSLGDATAFLNNLDLTDMFICSVTGGCPSKYTLANGQGSLLYLALATKQSGITLTAANANDLEKMTNYVRGLTGDLYGYTVTGENPDDNKAAYVSIDPTPNAVNGFWDSLMYGDGACVTSITGSGENRKRGEKCFQTIEVTATPKYDYTGDKPATLPAINYKTPDVKKEDGLFYLTEARLKDIVETIDSGAPISQSDKTFLGSLPIPVVRLLNSKKAGLFDDDDMEIIVEYISTTLVVSAITEVLDMSHRGATNVATLWSKSATDENAADIEAYLLRLHGIMNNAVSAAKVKERDVKEKMSEVTKKAQALIEQEEALRKMFFKSAAARMGGGRF